MVETSDGFEAYIGAIVGRITFEHHDVLGQEHFLALVMSGY